MKLLYTRHQRIQAGFGIIEIMIALALGVIIMLGVTEIAANNSNTRYELDRSGRQMENAAFALREIENDLTSAGFWGEKGAQGPGTFPPVCPDDIALLERSMGYPVQGWQEGKALGSNAFDCDNLGAIVPTAGTDYLAIRRASSCAVGETGCAAAGGNFHLQVHSCASDATRAGSFDISADLTSLNYLQRNCVDESPIYRFLNRIYYIDDDRLMRAELVWNPDTAAHEYQATALVEGVEMMRLEYGMDRDADGQVDAANGITFDPTDNPLAPGTPEPVDWANVVMVRISLVVRNTKPSGGFGDSKAYTVAGEDYSVPAGFEDHRRQVYSRTVGLRNVAGRREVAP